MNTSTENMVVSTNNLTNFGRLIIAFGLILMGAKIYHHLDFYGMELLIFAIYLVAILWFFKISFYSSAVVDELEFETKISINIFGYTTILLKVDSEIFMKNIWLKNKLCDFTDCIDNKNIKLELINTTPAQVKLTVSNKNN